MTAMKEALLSPSAAALLNSTGLMTLDADACDKQFGCALLLKQEGETIQLIKYRSWTLNDTEKRCNTAQNECLPIVWSLLILFPYFEETQFTTRPDHDYLK